MQQLDSWLLFAAVVRHGSFAKAARSTGVPTSSLSRKIQALETQLNGKLLHRSTRALSLTELGEQLLPRAELLAETLDELNLQAETCAEQAVGSLHLSASRSLSQYLLAPLLAEFAKLYPSISLNLDSSNRFQDLVQTKLDFAFRAGPLSDSSLLALPLGKVPYALVVAPALAKQASGLVHPQQLVEYPCIQAQIDGYQLPWFFEKGGLSEQAQGQATHLSDDFMVAKEWAKQGLGLAYLPRYLLRQELAQSQLLELLPGWQARASELYLVYSQRRFLPKKSQLFIEFIRQNQELLKQLLA